MFKLFLISANLQFFMQNPISAFPSYQLSEGKPENVRPGYLVLTLTQSDQVPETYREQFLKSGQVTEHNGLKSTTYITPKPATKITIIQDTYIEFSANVGALDDYWGFASDILSRAYKFSRKNKKTALPTVYVSKDTLQFDRIIKLTEGKIRAMEYANGRGDFDGVPAYFQEEAKRFAEKHKLQLTIIKGEELLQQGFRLMHAVGRASKNAPTFINLRYQGNPESDEWIAYVGKGVCFDAGGLNIKSTAGIKDMFLDKHGACSVFTAFQILVEEGAKVNVTASMGFVQNYVSHNSYRPSDIITSRKGINVEIGNTDAEGRLVLADCMNWTQQKYKTAVLIQLSTLTGAIITALGHKHAGLFTNDAGLSDALTKAGLQVHEYVWRMPLDEYHTELVKHKYGDITNHSGKSEASSCQAGAFLQHFVENGVKWIHLDIAGTSMVGGEGNGYGARLLVQYARNYGSP